ncbi:MAG: ribonuclease III [bacterium]|nr:ribonuclease III [bacterium]
MQEKLRELEQKIGYCFNDKSMLRHAMIHSSFANEHRLGKTSCNERLEFLGDAVLEVVTSEYLYHKYPEMPEGDMTKLRASTVCEPTLAYCAGAIPLGQYLLLGKGEDATGGRERDSVVSDAFEALIGAIYLDGGFANAKEFIMRFVLDDMEHKKLFYDSKTILQEIVQSRFEEPLQYELLKEEGPDHNKVFEVRVKVGNLPLGEGRGKTKKSAEQVAAYHGILKLGEKQV